MVFFKDKDMALNDHNCVHVPLNPNLIDVTMPQLFQIAHISYQVFLCRFVGGHRIPAVVCWASDHWVGSSNPIRGKFRHYFRLIPGV